MLADFQICINVLLIFPKYRHISVWYEFVRLTESHLFDRVAFRFSSLAEVFK